MFIRIKNTFLNLNCISRIVLVDETIFFFNDNEEKRHFVQYENAETAKEFFNKFGMWLSYKQANESVFIFQRE